MRAVMEALKSQPLLADTQTIGKGPALTGDHKDWLEWSFQFTACMGSANSQEGCGTVASMEEDMIKAAVVNTIFSCVCSGNVVRGGGSAFVKVVNTELDDS